jgi:hypothetical protein
MIGSILMGRPSEDSTKNIPTTKTIMKDCAIGSTEPVSRNHWVCSLAKEKEDDVLDRL